MRRLWGIRDIEYSKQLGRDYVEEADDERDAEAWLSTAPELAEVVYSDDGGDTWVKACGAKMRFAGRCQKCGVYNLWRWLR